MFQNKICGNEKNYKNRAEQITNTEKRELNKNRTI